MAKRALELGPEDIIARLREAEPPGKGGAGLSLASRLQSCRDAEGEVKYLVCNAVDGDRRIPLAKFLLSRRLEAVLEGSLIAGHAMGATHCVLCVNNDYADEIAALERALKELRQRASSGAEGSSVGIPGDISILRIPTSLVAAQDTALIRALEGRQPLPYLRDKDAIVGVRGAPTLVESVETLAAVAGLFAEQLSRTSAGQDRAGAAETTRIVAAHGDVAEPCVLEVPVGATIVSVLEQLEGRPVAELNLKAVQSGGPAGPFLSPEALALPIFHEDLGQGTPAPGSGSIRVFRNGRSALEIAREATAYLHDESCGQCAFCREGTRQLLDILDDLAEGGADDEHLELLRELAEAMRAGSICSIGRNASVPVMSLLRLFPEEFGSHVGGRPCTEGSA